MIEWVVHSNNGSDVTQVAECLGNVDAARQTLVGLHVSAPAIALSARLCQIEKKRWKIKSSNSACGLLYIHSQALLFHPEPHPLTSLIDN